MAAEEQDPVSYEDLAVIEDEFEDVDIEIMRKQYALTKSLYTKRTAAVKRVPNFWALVIEQAPLEIDPFIQPTDSAIFADCLEDMTVSRFELDEDSEKGQPRSLSIKFDFGENEYFTDRTLEKKFWYRRARDGWTGLVSEPVKVHWKKGKDLTEGLTDAAIALWEARRKAGDMQAKEMKEYAALKKKVEQWNGANTSFFTWFGFVSGRRFVSAEESREAMAARKIEREQAGKKAATEEAEDGTKADEDEVSDDQDVEVHEAGEDVAVGLAEDVWPNAIKFFTQAMESDMMSDVDFEDDDDEDDEDEDAEEGDDARIDIRSLVQDKGAKARSKGDGGPPSKKARKK